MSCTYCRIRHYKCDEKEPQCRRCQRANRKCVRETGAKFKHFKTPSQDQQTWLPVPPKVDFVDETNSLVEGAEDASSDLEDASTDAHDIIPTRPALVEPPLDAQAAPDIGSTVGTSTFDDYYVSSFLGTMKHHDPSGPSSIPSPTYNALRELARQPPLPSVDHHIEPRSPPAPCRDGMEWPLKTELEAMLLRHYIDHISGFFDLCEPYRFFRFDVPHRSRENSTLANAILALSARHLHWKGVLDSYAADRYQHACLQTLIPALNDPQAVLDESLLAATVLLRMLEELDVYIQGSDTQGHLTGLQAIIRVTKEAHAPPTGLRQAVCWAAFRQELWGSIQTQRPLGMSADMCGFERNHGFAPADDWVWAQRAVAHMGDALHWAFGASGETGVGGEMLWRRRLEENEAWRRHAPKSFEPFFGEWEKGLKDGEPFPDVRLCADWHANGHGYNLLAHLLLVVHDPTVPKLGPLRRRAIAAVDEKARVDVRKLCGVSASNWDVAPVALIASMAITLCGDRFIELSDQQRFHDFLKKIETRHGWPTARVRTQLEEAWGWEQENR